MNWARPICWGCAIRQQRELPGGQLVDLVEALTPPPPRPTQRSRIWVIWLILCGLTVVYLGSLLWLIGQTRHCDLTNGATADGAVFNKLLACRSINELGDFLAGAFAPLAFVWLAGAVFIQSRELATQRLELIETRAVMREQTKESAATKEYIRTQTEILQTQEHERKQRTNDEFFDSYIVSLVGSLTEPSSFAVAGEIFQLESWMEWNWPIVVSADRNKAIGAALFDIADRLESTLGQLNTSDYRTCDRSAESFERLSLLIDGVKEAKDLMNQLSGAKRLLSSALPFDRIERHGAELLRRLSEVRNRRIAKALINPFN